MTGETMTTTLAATPRHKPDEYDAGMYALLGRDCFKYNPLDPDKPYLDHAACSACGKTETHKCKLDVPGRRGCEHFRVGPCLVNVRPSLWWYSYFAAEHPRVSVLAADQALRTVAVQESLPLEIEGAIVRWRCTDGPTMPRRGGLIWPTESHQDDEDAPAPLDPVRDLNDVLLSQAGTLSPLQKAWYYTPENERKLWLLAFGPKLRAIRYSRRDVPEDKKATKAGRSMSDKMWGNTPDRGGLRKHTLKNVKLDGCAPDEFDPGMYDSNHLVKFINGCYMLDAAGGNEDTADAWDGTADVPTARQHNPACRFAGDGSTTSDEDLLAEARRLADEWTGGDPRKTTIPLTRRTDWKSCRCGEGRGFEDSAEFAKQWGNHNGHNGRLWLGPLRGDAAFRMVLWGLSSIQSTLPEVDRMVLAALVTKSAGFDMDTSTGEVSGHVAMSRERIRDGLHGALDNTWIVTKPTYTDDQIEGSTERLERLGYVIRTVVGNAGKESEYELHFRVTRHFYVESIEPVKNSQEIPPCSAHVVEGKSVDGRVSRSLGSMTA